MSTTSSFPKALSLILSVTLTCVVAVSAQSSGFERGKLVVLRVGDGGSALWINGKAATEGGMERLGDHTVLTVPGYCGNILSHPGTPSRLDYDRGVYVFGADGTAHLAFKGTTWYGLTGNKSNPRDVVTDGSSSFWGAGSTMGTLFRPATGDQIDFQLVPSTRAVKIINGSLLVSIMASDGLEEGRQGPTCGIYGFVDSSGGKVALPKASGATMKLELPATAPFQHIVSFDMDPQGNTAYVADTDYGIQKYVKDGSQWKLACNFYIPGYNGPHTGILTNATSTSVRAGCFGLVTDFSAPHPRVYATTTDSIGYDGKYINSNRLICVEDTNNITSGATITNFPQTLATAWATNIAFRAVAFAPEGKM